MQNLYQLVKHSLINSQNWTRYERRHPAGEQNTSDSVEDRLLIKDCKLKKANCWKSDCWVSSIPVEMAHAVWSLL